MMGPDDSNDSGWRDFRDFDQSKYGPSPFSYSDSTEKNIHSDQVFPDVAEQDLPEKM